MKHEIAIGGVLSFILAALFFIIKDFLWAGVAALVGICYIYVFIRDHPKL